jgi:hypothetical protein
MSEAQYETIVRHYASQRRYYPGKYVYRLLMKILKLEEPEPDQMKMEPVPPKREAQWFVNALMRSGRAKLDDVQVVVIEINEQIRPARPFIAALDEVRKLDTLPAFIQHLIALDVAPLLTADDFYRLDDHMNARGHEKVAAALARVISGSAGK